MTSAVGSLRRPVVRGAYRGVVPVLDVLNDPSVKAPRSHDLVVVVPGIMGSRLVTDDGPVWGLRRASGGRPWRRRRALAPLAVGEDERDGMRQDEDVAFGEGPRSAFFRRDGERAGFPRAREVDREARIRPRGEESRGRARFPAEERDGARLERVPGQRCDEGGLVVVVREAPAGVRRLVKEMKMRDGEPSLLQDRPQVAAEEARRLDEPDGEPGPRGARRHAVASFGRPRRKPASRATGAEAA